MSRLIDLSKPLSGEDCVYLKSRGKQHLIDRNKAEFADSEPTEETDDGEAEDEDYDEDDVTFVNSLDAKGLKAELKARDLKRTGAVPELKERLLDALAEEPRELEFEDDEDDDSDVEDSDSEDDAKGS